jgi:hypothetical protein
VLPPSTARALISHLRFNKCLLELINHRFLSLPKLSQQRVDLRTKNSFWESVWCF